MKGRVTVLLLAALLVAGCATSPPAAFYVLTPIPEAAADSPDLKGGELSVGLGPMVFPQFLDRPQLVVRDSENRLQVNEFQRWGGTVQDDFMRVWGENLAQLLGTSRILVFPTESRMTVDFRVLGEVVTFEGTPGGDAVLKVRWSVMDDRLERSVAAREDLYRCPIRPATPAGAAGGLPAGAREAGVADASAEAVVAAMSRCLGEFSRDVAQTLRTLPIPKPKEDLLPPLPAREER